MCNGTLMDKLISFSLPLMLSGILQLLFNAVDIIVVGRFTGRQALAAVGSTTALIIFLPICLLGSLWVRTFWQDVLCFWQRGKEMSETVHTSITLALDQWTCYGTGRSIAAEFALNLMGTPNDVIDQSVLSVDLFSGNAFLYAL